MPKFLYFTKSVKIISTKGVRFCHGMVWLRMFVHQYAIFCHCRWKTRKLLAIYCIHLSSLYANVVLQQAIVNIMSGTISTPSLISVRNFSVFCLQSGLPLPFPSAFTIQPAQSNAVFYIRPKYRDSISWRLYNFSVQLTYAKLCLFLSLSSWYWSKIFIAFIFSWRHEALTNPKNEIWQIKSSILYDSSTHHIKTFSWSRKIDIHIHKQCIRM